MTSFPQELEFEIMSVIMTLQDRGTFCNIKVFPPQLPDEDIFYEILFYALLGVGKEMESMKKKERIASLFVYVVFFLIIITYQVDNLPPKIVNLIPENVRYGQAYRWVNECINILHTITS